MGNDVWLDEKYVFDDSGGGLDMVCGRLYLGVWDTFLPFFFLFFLSFLYLGIGGSLFSLPHFDL
jgi:hypothetical protein